jgi:hypothetical protein
MLENMKKLNKQVTDWQINQVRLAGKQAQTTLTNTLSAWEQTVETSAALQQDLLNNTKATTTK